VHRHERVHRVSRHASHLDQHDCAGYIQRNHAAMAHALTSSDDLHAI
jgi:hypothetical protein